MRFVWFWRSFVLAVWAAVPAAAQDWVTPSSCALPEELYITTRDALPPTPAAGLPGAPVNGIGRAWKVTGQNGGKASYIWGALASSDRRVLDVPAELKGILSVAKSFVTEEQAVFSSRKEIAAEREARGVRRTEAMTGGSAEGAPEYLDPGLAAIARDRLDALGLGDDALSRLSDAGLAQALMSDPCEDFVSDALPLQPKFVLGMAYQAGLPIAGLAPRGALVADLVRPEFEPAARAIVTLRAAALDPSLPANGRATMVALYRQGRIGELMNYEFASAARILGPGRAASLDASASAYLVAERNRRFLDAMEPYLAAGSALVVLGARQIPGPDGVIEGLRARGYKVERVLIGGEAP